MSGVKWVGAMCFVCFDLDRGVVRVCPFFRTWRLDVWL